MNDKNTARAAKLNNNGTKALIVLSVLAAIIGGIASYVGPIEARMEYMSTRMDKLETELKAELKEHERLEAHVGAVKKMAAILEKFTEVETQFDGKAELRKALHEQNVEDIKKLEAWQMQVLLDGQKP